MEQTTSEMRPSQREAPESIGSHALLRLAIGKVHCHKPQSETRMLGMRKHVSWSSEVSSGTSSLILVAHTTPMHGTDILLQREWRQNLDHCLTASERDSMQEFHPSRKPSPRLITNQHHNTLSLSVIWFSQSSRRAAILGSISMCVVVIKLIRVSSKGNSQKGRRREGKGRRRREEDCALLARYQTSDVPCANVSDDGECEPPNHQCGVSGGCFLPPSIWFAYFV
jgi:hypothetical protein